MTAAAMPIEDPGEVLRRQVHPTQLDPEKVVSSAAFLPKQSDEGLLSTLRGRVPAQEAHQRHVSGGLQSVGTWGVSVAEAEEQALRAWDDEKIDGNPPDHASVDFTDHPANQTRKRVARKLRDAAVERGCLYRPAAP